MKEKEKDEVYPFGRFNRQVDLIKYTDKEYKEVIENSEFNNGDWSKLETDHLWRLLERFNLRFIIVADRFEEVSDDEDKLKKRDQKAKDKQKHKNGIKKYSERTVDEIKDRYYIVSKAILEDKN